MTEVKKSCRTCKLWNIKGAQDAAGRVRKDRSVRCLWVSTEVYPSSVNLSLSSRPTANYTTSENGTDCPCWTPRETQPREKTSFQRFVDDELPHLRVKE